MMIYVDTARCTGCGKCIAACPYQAIAIVDGRAHISQERCQGCEACLRICPEKAILSVIETAESKEATLPVSQGLVSVPDRVGRHALMAAAASAVVSVGRMVLPRLLDWALSRSETTDRARAQRGTASVSPHQHEGRQHRHRWGRG